MKEKELRIIGKNIRVYREKKGLSQSQLGTLLKSNKTRIAAIEQGKVNMYLTTLVTICSHLDVTFSEVFKGT